VKITVDSNVLVRSAVRDDVTQANAADEVLNAASLIAVPLACLCEFVWVLRRVQRFSPADIAVAIRALLATSNVVTNRPAVDSGLAVLEVRGDLLISPGGWIQLRRFIPKFCSLSVRASSQSGAHAVSVSLRGPVPSFVGIPFINSALVLTFLHTPPPHVWSRLRSLGLSSIGTPREIA
jgi:hypothetical protein